MLHFVPFLLAACGGLGGDASVLEAPAVDPAPPRPRDPVALPLHLRPDRLVRLTLPPSNRPEGSPAPEVFHPPEPFRSLGSRDGVDVWATALPIRSDLIADRLHSTHTFGSSAPPGFVVEGPDGPLAFGYSGRAEGHWGFDRGTLTIGLPAGAPAPDPRAYRVRLPRATEAEDALNFATSGLDARDFALRSFTLDTVSHAGLYLPAPATSSWRVEVPEKGVLGFRATVLEPAIRPEDSGDGAEIVVEIDDGSLTEVERVAVTRGRWDRVRVDLAAWSGRTVELTLRTEPGRTALYDHVFLEGPTLWTPTEDPRRVLLVYVDTLRADHLGTYGYDRPTSPRLDGWAAHGAVFEAARTIAPWTLPSARAALSGRQPELWSEGPTLAERLAAAGYHTEAVVTNAFLSQPFGMERGFVRYTYRHLASAEAVSQQAIDTLRAWPDRDVALLVHFMDPHLPYEEPWPHRWRFAGPPPRGLESLSRRWLVDLRADHPRFDAIKEHVIARYDQNIRYVDTELHALLEAAGPGATVALFSDHGEEFWDHGGFEHGHTFHEELLRVPLVLRGPGVPPGRHEAPVSLLDLPSTVLELEGLPSRTEAGRSLVPLLWGEEEAARSLARRPHAFGRPLYGHDGWGVIDAGRKWIDRAGRQRVFDLREDPGETTDLAEQTELAPWPTVLGEALDRETALTWHVQLTGRAPDEDRLLTLSHPDGVRAAWAAYDPRGRHRATRIEIDAEGVLHVHQPASAPWPPAVFVVPQGDPTQTAGLELRVSGSGTEVKTTASKRTRAAGPNSPVVAWLRGLGVNARVGFARAPLPEGEVTEGFAEELEAQLRELGYLD